MGKTRDFRASTVEYIRKNLVDEDAGGLWDGVCDIFSGVFSFNRTLDADLGNFDKYMARICEINDISAAKFNQILADVQTMENTYAAQLDADAANISQILKMMNILSAEVGKEDFEKAFDKNAVGVRLGRIKLSNPPPDFSGMSPEAMSKALALLGDEEFAAALALLSAEDITQVDTTQLSAEQQFLYYTELKNRLFCSSLPEDSLERQLLLNAFALMPNSVAMRMVYNPDDPNQYGGNQGYGVKNKNDQAYQDFLLSLLAEKFDLSGLSAEQIETLVDELIKDMNASGCGYIAMVNAICVEYAGKPAAFEEKFGFPLYDGKGNFNFPYLFGYVYLTNINPDFDPAQPYRKEETETEKANRPITGGGGSAQLRQQTLAALGVEGVQSDGKTYPVHSGDIRDELEQGHTVVLTINPCVMHPVPPGSPKDLWNNVRPSGHAVVVTGVAENGDLTVSSWGKQYTIPAAEFQKYTQTYPYTNDDGNADSFTGSILYEVYE